MTVMYATQFQEQRYVQDIYGTVSQHFRECQGSP